MKVVVTGGAGKLGRRVCQSLVEAGDDVRAVDAVYGAGLPCPQTVANLLDSERCYEWMEGADSVVHLGNIPNISRGTPQRVYSDNCRMNVNVFQAACDLGVSKLVFASSVQAIGGVDGGKSGSRPISLELPLDGTESARPQNVYGLSKLAGENLLAALAEASNIEAVAIRFPCLVHEGGSLRHLSQGDPTRWLHLSFFNAAALVVSCLHTSLPGFRIFTPAETENFSGWAPEECLRHFGYDGPLRKPLAEISSLVDVSPITRATGWVPRREKST